MGRRTVHHALCTIRHRQLATRILWGLSSSETPSQAGIHGDETYAA